MDILFWFFERPMYYSILASTVVFVILYFLTQSRVTLSRFTYFAILFEMIFVSLHFTARMNNIVITKDIAFQVINFTLFILWMAHIFDKETYRFTPTPLNIPVFVFFWACIVGGFLAPRMFWYYAAEWCSRYAASILLFYLMINVVTTRKRWNLALYTFLAMMVISSIYCIMQINGYDFMNWGRIVNVSTFGNKDFAASFWTYTAPVALFMAVGARNIFDGLLYAAMAGLGIYNLWVGETRGAWVGMMAMAGLWVLFEARFAGRLRMWIGDWKRQMIAWGSLVLVVVLVSSAVMSRHRIDTFKSIFQTDWGTNIIRVYMWWTGARMVWDSPMVGQGLGASHVTYPFFRPDRYHRIGMSHNTDYVHSEPLQFLCEQGILGFSAWLAMLVVLFYLAYRKLKTIDDMTERYTFFGIMGAFFAAVVHDSMNVNLRWTSSMIAFWYELSLATRYIIGFAEEPDAKKQVLRETRRRVNVADMDPRRYIIFPLLAAAFAFMIYAQYRVIRSDWSLKSTEEGGGRAAIATGMDTLKYNPYCHSAYYKIAFHYLNEQNIQKALDNYIGLLQIAPNYAQTHQNTGLIYYRLFGNTNLKKYLYQSVMEFEWATTLENNFENHTKMLQLYTQMLNDSSRGRYHNQFIFWQVQEDSFFSNFRLWRVFYLYTDQSYKNYLQMYSGFEPSLKDSDNFSREYWLYRTDTVRRIGRPRHELRYAMKMSTRYVPNNPNLLQFALGTILSMQEPQEDLVYLANILERLEPGQASPESLLGLRQQLSQIQGGPSASPLVAYSMGVLSYKVGDMANAREYFFMAKEKGERQYELIRQGIKKYKI